MYHGTGRQHEMAVNELLPCLTSSTVMAYYSPDLEIVVVDTGPYIPQRDEGIHHIVADASHALTDMESRYSQTECEAQVEVWSCEQLHLYIYGHHFSHP